MLHAGRRPGVYVCMVDKTPGGCIGVLMGQSPILNLNLPITKNMQEKIMQFISNTKLISNDP